MVVWEVVVLLCGVDVILLFVGFDEDMLVCFFFGFVCGDMIFFGVLLERLIVC